MLLLGGGGQIGTAIREAYRAPITAPSHAEFDIVTGDIEARIASEEIGVVVNCAAFHNVDRCEHDAGTAFAVNALAVDRMAAACAHRRIPFVTISTDYVFNGDVSRPYHEQDAPDPRTAYGASKLAGELLARRHGPTTIVVRTSGVFGTTGTSSKGYSLVEKVLAQAERGEVTRMVYDVTFSPSYAPHVARAILDLIDHNASGIHHVTNTGNCTWYEYVQAVFRKAGYPNAPLEPITYKSLASPAQRPKYSALVNTTFSSLGIMKLPQWEDALDAFLSVRRRRLSN